MRNTAVTGKRIGYGWLYNFHAADDLRGLAPDNWHVPNQPEWENMLYKIYDPSEYDSTIKSDRHEWKTPNLGMDFSKNPPRFLAHPAGYRLDTGIYYNISEIAIFWSSDMLSLQVSNNSPSHALDVPFGGENGYSIRCVQEKRPEDSDGDSGTVFDIDGNEYNWVVIGDLRWMTENLRTTRYKNGNLIPEVTSAVTWSGLTTGARCAYNNDHYFVYPPHLAIIKVELTGTVEIFDSDILVWGNGTSFTSELEVGNIIEVDGVRREVVSIIDDMFIDVDSNFHISASGLNCYRVI